jgi:hypothetical protein
MEAGRIAAIEWLKSRLLKKCLSERGKDDDDWHRQVSIHLELEM